MAGLAKW